ncbi:flagellar hook-basal body complex protein FliE [Oceanospirillum multiglobuliferum]|uniref:Flagellar hook-basal body complex protein FliE n=1 Tax=Oceanospirillum multiglobuliferum TaxID=64969 RepID=A0A1T4L4A6_9GAMM|nr:flagellar hook-basal body complex protein FliE [Oceanospirillum multiglobuliferum]OPX56813.1 flagellar hook-basal body complex protein FliE [Oceanospirillum multiglobuliferum]SJZ49350.1 flagellar hook-basal body complex protein FliE [Oceanospirillum multiglobuliferum]
MVDRADISGVLNQIRSMQSEMHQTSRVTPVVSPVDKGARVEASDAPSFADMLKGAIDKVNETQKTASALREAYEMGDPEVDIVQVMVASQKSTVAFEAMTQVRNKLVSAYQEIMRMPV